MKTKSQTNIQTKYKYEDIAALEVENIDEDFVIAAYGDGIIPSCILQNQETKKFSKIQFSEFEGYRIWSADLSGDSLKICLVK